MFNIKKSPLMDFSTRTLISSMYAKQFQQIYYAVMTLKLFLHWNLNPELKVLTNSLIERNARKTRSILLKILIKSLLYFSSINRQKYVKIKAYKGAYKIRQNEKQGKQGIKTTLQMTTDKRQTN